MQPLAVDWGRRVQERRKELGLTQTQLADLCDVTQQTISQVESGRIVPVDRLKIGLAHALGTRPGVLFPWPDTVGIAGGAR